jgi:CRP/FNR family transcriptional regulator, cyclic AMP receptor protein
MDASAALRASPLFAEFTDTGISILAGIAVPKQIPAGTPLFVENMVSDSLLLVAEGRVMLVMRGERGDLPLGELGPGDWLGELSLLASGQRMCTATAITPVSAFEIRQGDFQKLMGTKPQACMKLLMAICTTLGAKIVANKDQLRALATRG